MPHRHHFLVIVFGLFSAVASAQGPISLGQAGSVRSGIPYEAVFSNPAAVALVGKSQAFYYFTKSALPDAGAGGRAWAAGTYDGENEYAKAGLAYSRESRARFSDGQKGYEDRNTIHAALGRALSASVLGGLNARYVTRREMGRETKYFSGDLGLLWQAFADMRIGFTYENFLKKAGEPAANYGVGGRYSLGSGMAVLGDYSQIADGPKNKQKSWSLATELMVAGDFLLRGGVFKESETAQRGYAAGLSWMGPRASFHYAFRKTKAPSREQDHTLGMSVEL